MTGGATATAAREIPAAEASGGPRTPGRLRLLVALPGIHRVQRGAEAALESVATELARKVGWEVTVIGTGPTKPERGYRYIQTGCIQRERFMGWPRVPAFRDHYSCEEFTFVAAMQRHYRPGAYDVTATCGYPWLNWALRMRRRRGHPAHVFVTQNGDWPVQARNREYRWFGCDGLVCTNPEYFERHRARWRSALIPNGVDTDEFHPGRGDRSLLGVPAGVPLILMVSALIASKRVVEGIRAVAGVRDAHLVVLGDGETAAEADRVAVETMPGRYRRLSLPRERMPEAYRCADAVLHMSKDEPFGNVYIEALASGLPIVAHDWEGTRWILEDTSLLIDTDSIGVVQAGLRDALGATASALVAARRELASRRFSWTAIGQQYADFIRGVVERAA